MRMILAALLLCCVLVLPIHAQNSGGAPSPEFSQVIEGQLNAFQKDDGATAYSYAAPSIQKIFPTVDIFMDMVRKGYPQVYRPKSYKFLNTVTDSAGRPGQRVLFVGPDGKPYIALYSMQQQADGSWKISACTILPAEGSEA